MEQNGWTVTVDRSNRKESNYRQHEEDCSINTFYGYSVNGGIGSVSYTFKKSGKGILSYGNCRHVRHTGYVAVTLNGTEFSSTVSHYWVPRLAIFYYKKDDILKIAQHDGAIIQLYYFVLQDCGKR